MTTPKKIKPIVAWAVMNMGLNEVCLTGVLDDDPVAPDLIVGAAIFDSKEDAVKYRKEAFTGKDGNMFPGIKVIKVKITPL